MDILYLADPVFNYGTALLFDGLCEISNVSVIVTPALNRPYVREDITFNVISEQEAMENSFDFAVLSNLHDETVELSMDIKVAMRDLPFVCYFNADDPTMGIHIIDFLKPHVVFLREYYHNREYPSNCFPLPFSFPHAVKQSPVDRPIDVLFSMSSNNLARIAWLNLIKSHCTGLEVLTRLDDGFDADDWFVLLTQSKIVISIRGFGYETSRFYEGISHGACVISDDTTIIRPNPFIHNQHVIYTDESTLVHDIHRAVNGQEWIDLSIQGQLHFMKYHTTVSRANYFLEKVQQFI